MKGLGSGLALTSDTLEKLNLTFGGMSKVTNEGMIHFGSNIGANMKNLQHLCLTFRQ